MKYSEILKKNSELGVNLYSAANSIVVLSNITIHQIKEILEYPQRMNGINANVEMGNHDNIVQDSLKFQDSNLVIIFWELCNLIDGLTFKIELFNKIEFNEILDKTKSEIDLVLKNLQNAPLVLFNRFSPLLFSNSSIRKSNFERFADCLNHYLEETISNNVKLISIEKVIAEIGIYESLDHRYYYSSKAPYTVSFFKAYSEYVKPIIMAANGKAKKALIFDCDNTLWKGILGEDGFDHIDMSTENRDGSIFHEIQSISIALSKQGVLIGLCSKNNPDDVEEVLISHPDMLLRNEHIAVNKSNWSNKVTNLRQIAQELNIGLDSLVFVDDSPFEVNFIREQLPEVTVLQVPEKLYEYPKMLRENVGLFYNLSVTAEDRKKTEMIKQQINRERIKNEFESIDDYLSSLRLGITVYQDDTTISQRMAQLSQKTNQFNLTTKRYTEEEIRNYITQNGTNVFSFSVSDKFGDNGVCGLCIVNLDGGSQTAEIDTFLMSCRVIGRNIEYAFMNYLIEYLTSRKIKMIRGRYEKTLKNKQVEQFYETCSFSTSEKKDKVKSFKLNINQYKPKKLGYIEVKNGR